ncbi:unnamed protein product, partial [Dibothriocephalus latus]
MKTPRQGEKPARPAGQTPGSELICYSMSLLASHTVFISQQRPLSEEAEVVAIRLENSLLSECEGSCENGSCYSSPPRLEALSTVASPQSPLPSAPTTTAVTPTAGVPRPLEVDKTPTQESTVSASSTPSAPAE